MSGVDLMRNISHQADYWENDLNFHWQTETGNNQSSVTTFILLGFESLFGLQILFFLLLLAIYILSISGNLLIVFLVVVDQHLHTPMYFFLMNLSCLEICYTTTILPRMLASFLTGDRSISMKGCITQYYFFGFLLATECYLLAMMSYDRYLAICKPLHYAILMNSRLCMQLALISWASGLVTNTIITSFVLDLRFCGPNEIDHFFCDINPVTNLSCSSTRNLKFVTIVLAFITTGPPFVLTLASYVYIIVTILKLKSRTAQQKAFSTCSSHLIVVTLFYVSLIIAYVVPETDTLKELHKNLSVFYTVMTPLLNPLIYSLRNKEVKEAFFRSTRKFSNRVSQE